MNIDQLRVQTVRNRGQTLIWMLRTIGLLDLFALLAVLAPRDWIANIHQALGLGEFPIDPIAGYLARCTSFWYAAYGLLLWFISCDPVRYSNLITCLASMMVLQGLVAIGIDILEGMPVWWTVLEGPCCLGFGVIVLTLQRCEKIGSYEAS